MVLVETLWAAGSPGFACAESFHPVTPVNASVGELLTSRVCLFGDAYLVLFNVFIMIYTIQLRACL